MNQPFFKQDLTYSNLQNSFDLSDTNTYTFYDDVNQKEIDSPKTKDDLVDSQIQNLQVWITLQSYFSSGVRLAELRSIAKFLQFYLNLPIISRNASRSFNLLIKWFENNWKKILPFLPYISLYDDNLRPINQFREVKK